MGKRFDKIEDALDDMRLGRVIVLVDDEDRENEGDLCCAAEKVTPEIISFMAVHGRGLICLSIEEAQVEKLELPMMSQRNRSPFHTNFTVSIEAARGVTTGISAADRANTILTAIRKDAVPTDVVVPGHIFPVKALPGGVLQRAGQTEGSVDLARLAGLNPSGVICEIMNEDGTMARYPELRKFSDTHKLKMVTVKDLIAYRLTKEKHIVAEGSKQVQTKYGEFKLSIFKNQLNDEVYLAFVKGEVRPDQAAPVRVHAQHRVFDAFELLLTTDTKINRAFDMIAAKPCGAFIYLLRNRSSDEIMARIDDVFGASSPAPKQVQGSCTPGPFREYGFGAQVIHELGFRKILLITDNPRYMTGLESYGLEVEGVLPLAASI